MTHDSQGRRALVRILATHNAAHIAIVCGVTRQAVSQWSTGAHRPGERCRSILATRYAIARGSWFEPVEVKHALTA